MIGRTLVMGRTVGALALTLAVAAPGAAIAQEAGPTQATGGANPAATRNCDPLLARTMPGSFNFCVAANDWKQGRRDRALELLELSAGWDDKAAQMALGVAYFNGDGVAQDRALGLAWLGLAAERHDPKATALFASARSKVDSAEFARADGLYQQMLGRYADQVAAARADLRFIRETKALRGDAAYGVGPCLEGFTTQPFTRINDAAQSVSKLKPCSLASARNLVTALEQRYEVAMEGWNGRVTVGAVQPVKEGGKP